MHLFGRRFAIIQITGGKGAIIGGVCQYLLDLERHDRQDTRHEVEGDAGQKGNQAV